MEHPTYHVPMALTLSAALLLPGSVLGAHRCANAAGEVTFTDQPCPADTVAKQAITLPPPAPVPVRALNATSDPNSIMGQVQKPKQDQASRQAVGNPEYESKLSDIEDKLAKIVRDEKDLQEDLKPTRSSVRRRWAKESLQELNNERQKLLRERENILRLAGDNDRYAAARIAGAENRAQQIEEAAQQEVEKAKIRQKHAEQQAMNAKIEADRLKAEAIQRQIQEQRQRIMSTTTGGRYSVLMRYRD